MNKSNDKIVIFKTEFDEGEIERPTVVVANFATTGADFATVTAALFGE